MSEDDVKMTDVIKYQFFFLFLTQPVTVNDACN